LNETDGCTQGDCVALRFAEAEVSMHLELRANEVPQSRLPAGKMAVSWLVSLRFALVALAALFGLYAVVLRPWFIDWGSTAEERAMALPGDELNPEPTWQVTRAVTIGAPADVVWAWLIQHGQDRAGFYSYDWLENLVGADIHNVDELRSEWQERSAGEGIPMSRGFGSGRIDATVLTVRISEPNRALVTTAADGGVGARVLIPIDDQTTRLIFRDREGDGDASVIDRAYHWLIWEPMHFVMQHRMMLGVKARAEGDLNEPRALYVAARVGWLAAGIAVLGVLAVLRRFSPWLGIPVVAAAPALLFAGDPAAALAGFLAAGITTTGALRFGARWWPPFSLIATGVLLVLLLAPDAYIAFGLIFDGVLFIAAARWAWLHQSTRAAPETGTTRGVTPQ
jgi:hypothetical protein